MSNTKKKTTKKSAAKKVTKRRKPAARTPKGMVVITSPVRSDLSFYVASEMADDTLIEQEVLGSVLPTMIYKFSDKKGNEVKGLSLNGVRETVRRLNKNPGSGSKIRIAPEPPIINHNVEYGGEKGVEVLVYAEDLISGGGSWGSKFEPYVKTGRNGTYKNPFALEMALSKAQRNAQRALIPEKIVTEMIDKLIRGKDAVQQIEEPKVVSATVAPSATGNIKMLDATMKRIDQISGDEKKLKDAIKKLDALPLNKDQKAKVKGTIEEYLAVMKV